MSPRMIFALLAALLAAGSFAAQPRSKAKPKPPPIKPEPLALVPGQPMSARALTQRPVPLVNLRGWTLETRRHRGPIYCFAYSPDEKLVATAGHDATIRLWDTSTGKLVRAMVGHGYVVTSLTFSPDGKILASAGSSDGTVRLWETAEGQPLRTFSMKGGYASWVAWSPDGKNLAVAGGKSGYLWMYDAAGDRGDVVAETGNPIHGIAWSNDSRYLAVASVKVPLWLIDASASGDKVIPLGEAADAPQSVAWSPDDKHLLAGSTSFVNVWDVAAKKPVEKLTTPGANVDWSPDGKTFATAAAYGNVTIWDAESRKMRRPPVPNTAVYKLGFQEDGSLAILSFTKLETWKIDGEAPAKAWELTGRTPPQWQPSRPVITGLGEKALALWSATTGKRIAQLEGHTGPIAVAAWAKDGKHLATGGHDGRVLIWDATGKRTATGERAGTVVSLSWSPDGKQLASGATDHKVTIWDAASGNQVRTFDKHEAAVHALAWCPAGKLLAAGGYDKRIKVWNLETGKAEELSKEWPAGLAMAWSSNGKYLATGGASDALRFWCPTGKAPNPIGERAPQPPVTLISWAPGNEVLAVCRTGSGIALYSVQTGKYLHGLSNWGSAVHVGWSAKAETIAVGCDDRTVRFWDTGSGLLRAMLIAEPGGTLATVPEGYYRCDPSVEAELIVVTQTERGQETHPVTRFASKHKWKNLASQVRLTP